MRITRRQFGNLAATACGSLCLGGCTEIAWQASRTPYPSGIGQKMADPIVIRALNRMAYGPRITDLERVQDIGVDSYVEEQLSPQHIRENSTVRMRLATLETLNLSSTEAQTLETVDQRDDVITPHLWYLMQLPNLPPEPEPGSGLSSRELQQACILRSVYSSRQLLEVMVEFWSDHFNINQGQDGCAWLKTVDDREVRKHALGNFRDLLEASAHSPAMLCYLNNDQNRKSDEAFASFGNENYARELLELHTLGVDGGYTLKDIQEVARCFTGWTVKQGIGFWPGEFTFRRRQHDEGPKTVLGVPFPAGQGKRDGQQVIEILCRHPSTARFIARKLCRRFISDQRNERLETQLADVFARTNGDIKKVLSYLFHSPEFQRGRDRKFKRPYDYIVSALRATNADTDGLSLLPYLRSMGQSPYRWPMPDGYPDRLRSWKSGMLNRWNFALDLVTGRIQDTCIEASELLKATQTTVPLEVCRRLSTGVLGAALEDSRLHHVADFYKASPSVEATRQCLALLLASPQFQWR